MYSLIKNLRTVLSVRYVRLMLVITSVYSSVNTDTDTQSSLLFKLVEFKLRLFRNFLLIPIYDTLLSVLLVTTY